MYTLLRGELVFCRLPSPYPIVDLHAAREDTRHFIRVQRCGFFPLPRSRTSRNISASVLGKEDRDRVILEELDLLGITRALDCVVSAPFVYFTVSAADLLDQNCCGYSKLTDVITPEVNGIVLGSAVEVVRDVCADLLVVVGGISDTEPALAVVLDIRLGIALYGRSVSSLTAISFGITHHRGLDVCRCARVIRLVCNFVASEEANDIVVLAQFVDDVLVPLEEFDIPLGVLSETAVSL